MDYDPVTIILLFVVCVLAAALTIPRIDITVEQLFEALW